jgi:hypothetical protein
MRKWIAIIIVLILILASVYWLIPVNTSIHQKLIIPVNTKAFAREISDEQNWQQWWPGKTKQIKQFPASLEYSGNTYTIVEKKLSSLVIIISKAKDSVLTELIFIPVQNDSIELTWNGVGRTASNPISRLQNLSWIKGINSDIHLLLKKILSFYSNEDNLYNFHIQKDFVIDSNLVSTSTRLKTYPSVDFIYNMIDRLENYIQRNNARQTNPPMLNISKDLDGTYLTRVALPVDRRLKDSGDIQYRWMLGRGNILITEVKGGPSQINRAFDEMTNYIEDHHRIAPAISFQSLITDRTQEPDTNKWITKLYWPVM